MSPGNLKGRGVSQAGLSRKQGDRLAPCINEGVDFHVQPHDFHGFIDIASARVIINHTHAGHGVAPPLYPTRRVERQHRIVRGDARQDDFTATAESSHDVRHYGADAYF